LKYFQNYEDLHSFHQKLKQYKCPHCNILGYLILHGFLYGYSDITNNHGFIRGRRFFCSNRYSNRGCGKTFSLLKSCLIRKMTFTAKTVWAFISNLYSGLNIFHSFFILNIPASVSTPYRLFVKLKQHQFKIREQLLKIQPPPEDNALKEPFILTIKHLKEVFGDATQCPITAFQHTFQTSII